MASANEKESDEESLSDLEDAQATFFKELEDSFGTSDLYSVLNIEDRKCNSKSVTKAYHRLSIKVHPDRVKEEEKERATHKFQLLGRAYHTLSDPVRRSEYDEFGSIRTENGTDCPEGARDWNDYWRVIYPKILLEEVEKFKAEYQGSEDELSDLKAAYIKNEGNMELILEVMMCCTYTDDERFRGLLTPMVESGEIPSFDRFTKESKKTRLSRKRKGEREAKEAEKCLLEQGFDLGGENLVAKIKSRSATRMDSFLNHLEEKYGEKDEKLKRPKLSRKTGKSKSKTGSKK